MSFQGIVGDIVDEGRDTIRYEWEIDDFLTLMEASNNPHYHSPAFDCWGSSFFLKIYPNGEYKKHSRKWIALYLVLRKPCSPIDVEFEFAIKTDCGRSIENIYSDSRRFTRNKFLWGWPCFLSQDILLSRQDELLPFGVLRVAVKMKTNTYRTEIVTFNQSVQTDFENSVCEESKDVNPEKTGAEKVLEDIVKAWQSGDNCDVLFRVRGEEFRAHRAILGARSPVLLAMFRHLDTAEGRSGEVKIEDCEPEVFRDFLNYIYTGEELPGSKTAAALYAVADKYLAEDLKGRCLERVKNGLGVDNFCETVALALRYGEGELLQQATDFASENIRQIIKSVEWQKFIQDEPVTANEILIKALGS